MKNNKLLLLIAVLGLLASACGSGGSTATSSGSDGSKSDSSSPTGDTKTDDTSETGDTGSQYGEDFDPTIKAKSPHKIGVSLQQQKANFWVAVKNGSTDAATILEAGEPDFADANGEEDKQLNDVKTMLSAGIEGLVLGAVNSGSAEGIVEETAAAGIPVVAVALQVGDPKVYGGQHIHEDTIALVTNDDEQMGVKAAEFVQPVAEEKGEALNIVILQGTPGTSNAELRDGGFKKGLEALGIEHKISNEQSGKFKREEAKVACENMLAADETIDLIYSHSDEMTIGCVTAMENLNRTDIPIASIGGNSEGIELLKEGKILGTVCQKPATMGAVATQVLIRHLDGEEIPREVIFYETPTITKDNLEDCEPEW